MSELGKEQTVTDGLTDHDNAGVYMVHREKKKVKINNLDI